MRRKDEGEKQRPVYPEAAAAAAASENEKESRRRKLSDPIFFRSHVLDEKFVLAYKARHSAEGVDPREEREITYDATVRRSLFPRRAARHRDKLSAVRITT